MKENKRIRNWMLTINYKNIEVVSDDQLKNKLDSIKGLLYYAFQLEKGEEGTYHHQLLLCFKNGRKFETVKTTFPHAHIEEMKGTHEQANDYVTKEDTREHEPIIFGELPKKGRRSDLVEIVEMIEDGACLGTIRKLYPSQYLRYQTKIQAIHQEVISERFGLTPRLDIQVIYLCDKPGVGKTKYIAQKYGYGNFYSVTNYKNPFDLYKNEDVIVFEEFRESLSLSRMLSYLDVHPVRLPSRYYDKQACYTKVYVISNWNWEEQYNDIKHNDPNTYDAWRRRFHFIGDLAQVKRFEDEGLF